MPGYKGHLLGGLGAFGLTVALLLSATVLKPTFLLAIQWLLCCLAGSLFPDVDTKSKGQKYFYWLLCALFVFLFLNNQYYLMGVLSFIAVLPMLVPHRGLFHRLWFVILFPALLAFGVNCYVAGCSTIIASNTLFFITGAISHLWLDLGFRRMVRF